MDLKLLSYSFSRLWIVLLYIFPNVLGFFYCIITSCIQSFFLEDTPHIFEGLFCPILPLIIDHWYKLIHIPSSPSWQIFTFQSSYITSVHTQIHHSHIQVFVRLYIDACENVSLCYCLMRYYTNLIHRVSD